MGDPRRDLISVYEAGVRRVRGFDAVRDYLERRAEALPRKICLVAVGKAASAMARGALEVLGGRIADGLVVTKHGHVEAELAAEPRIECIESDHPVPDADTLRAGERLLAYLSERTGGDAGFLFLLSGGASSLVEVLPRGLGLADLRRLTEALLASGLDIAEMNRVRRALSGVKGGRLAAHLGRRPTLSLLISDVPGDDPGVIGSGLLTPVRERVDPGDYLDVVRELLGRVELVPVPEQAEFDSIESHIVACLDDAKAACRDEALRLGYADASVSPTFIAGDVEEVAERLFREIGALADVPVGGTQGGMRGGMRIWGGEPTVKLPAKPGRGGRNQQLALAVAMRIKGEPGVYFLSVGTDGTDGPTADAGALVDGATLERGEQRGFDAGDRLRRADAGTFLEASGDLVTTGPTGTNVMDLMIGLKVPGAG